MKQKQKTKNIMPGLLFSAQPGRQKNDKKNNYSRVNKQLRQLINDDNEYCVLGYN